MPGITAQSVFGTGEPTAAEVNNVIDLNPEHVVKSVRGITPVHPASDVRRDATATLPNNINNNNITGRLKKKVEATRTLVFYARTDRAAEKFPPRRFFAVRFGRVFCD